MFFSLDLSPPKDRMALRRSERASGPDELLLSSAMVLDGPVGGGGGGAGGPLKKQIIYYDIFQK